MTNPILHSFLLSLILAFNALAQQAPVFPQPNSVVVSKESVTLKGNLSYAKNPDIDRVLKVMNPQFMQFHSIQFIPQTGTENPNLVAVHNPEFQSEKYTLLVSKSGIQMEYGDYASLLYAFQTLDQYMRDQRETIMLRSVVIEDSPRFAYRGMHLDCSRHFFTISEIKALLDQLSALKINRFHWHLTDDQGWRLEIKQFPKLTSVGAWRDSTLIDHYSHTPRLYSTEKYGGFYTQEEAKEIVRYANERGIEVIPEIEMPGHARAALAAYPDLGCTGKKMPVPGLWGVFDDVFCSSPETIDFLQKVLDEVITIFPSKTIHIGGDEVPKVRWEVCPKCKNTCAKNGLKDSHELQSYFIQQMDNYLQSKGKQLMGWDEILEGGLAKNAQVMSWRGTEGGIAAANQGHEVVMTPTSHCYFDYYQSGHPAEPLAIGGYLPLEKVYGYDPLPTELSPEKQQLILGAQANVWTEYLPTMNAVEYNAFPRLVAMAQLLWTKKLPDYNSFVLNLSLNYLNRLKLDSINYSTAFLDPKITPTATKNGLIYTIEAPLQGMDFQLNGERSDSIVLKKTKMPTIENKELVVRYQGKPLRKINYSFTTHNGIGLPVEFITPPHLKYNHNGELGLTDGVVGIRPWKGNQWLGFNNDTVQFTLNLGSKKQISGIELGCLDDAGSWIYLPQTIEVEYSEDGKEFITLGKQKIQSEKVMVGINKPVGFLKFTIINKPTIEAGQPGAGNVPWTFLDELIVK